MEKETNEKKELNDIDNEDNEEKKDNNSQALVLFENKNEKNFEKNDENKSYNDVNYWHIELSKDIDDDILKEIE